MGGPRGSRRRCYALRRWGGGADDDAAVWLLADALAFDAVDGGDDVMNDLPLERGHRRELLVLTTLGDPLGGAPGQVRELLAPLGLEAVDVDGDAHPALGLPEHGQTSQLLERGECLALLTDHEFQPRTLDVDMAAGAVHPGGDVAVNVQYVQESFDEVGGQLRVGGDRVGIGDLGVASRRGCGPTRLALTRGRDRLGGIPLCHPDGRGLSHLPKGRGNRLLQDLHLDLVLAQTQLPGGSGDGCLDGPSACFGAVGHPTCPFRSGGHRNWACAHPQSRTARPVWISRRPPPWPRRPLAVRVTVRSCPCCPYCPRRFRCRSWHRSAAAASAPVRPATAAGSGSGRVPARRDPFVPAHRPFHSTRCWPPRRWRRWTAGSCGAAPIAGPCSTGW